MTHYFIDDQWNLIKGPVSVDEISKLANEYQDKYFPGQKPTVSIQVTNSPQFHGAGCYEPAAKKIWLAERVTEFENTLKIALLHEMIHANMHARGFDADPNHEHPGPMTMDYDPISSLEAVGYLEREASFLYLVAIHSGYFLRRQYSQFVQCDRGAMPTRFLEKASRLHHLRVIECGQGRHIYHLASKPVYEAVGRPDSQNRRIKGDSYIKARLMVLDYVLLHLSANILEDEAGKVDFFTTQCGVRSELLPRSYAGRLMYFPDGFPILVSNTGFPSFVFFDEGQVTATRFERYLKQYQPLFAALGEFELVFVADNESNSARAKAAFGRFLPADRMRGVTPITPLGVDHFLEFFSIRRQSEVEGRGILANNLQVLREGEGIYTTLEHQALYSAWKLGTASTEKIRQRFLQTSLRATFSTVLLPYSYPTSALQHNQPVHEGERTR